MSRQKTSQRRFLFLDVTQGCRTDAGGIRRSFLRSGVECHHGLPFFLRFCGTASGKRSAKKTNNEQNKNPVQTATVRGDRHLLIGMIVA
jgi:hypothetical protein